MKNIAPISRRIRTILQTSIVWLCVVAAAVEANETRIVEENVAVPMRDGTVLRADIFRPAGEGPFPVLVHRTPYGKRARPAALEEAGFIVATVDLRGRYASGGKFESFHGTETHDDVDGYDTIEWAANLPGSDGRVGTIGTSYDAFVQWKGAARQPPSLRAMAAFSIPARYTDLEMPGTVRPGRRWEWWFTNSADINKKDGGPLPHDPKAARELWDAGRGKEIMDTLPWLDLPDSLFGHEAKVMKAWLREPWVDPWKLDEDAAHVTVPNLNICGWYDHCNGSIDLHTAIVRSGASEAARNYSKLIVGPWSHSLGQKKGTINFGPNARVDLTDLQVKWFTHWLKENATDDFSELPPVRLFVMGLGQWKNYDVWPPAEAQRRAFYLSGDGAANTPRGDGRLVEIAPPNNRSDSYIYDPRDPVPTLWSDSSMTEAAEQSPLAERRDILVYQTPPLDAPLETVGYPEAMLFAASDQPDADFFARLIDVAPNGTAIDVTQGMVRARHRVALDKVTLLTPGETVEFHIKMRPTAHRFLQGHRIRLDVTSSDFPSFDRNHNTAADPNEDAELVAATETIHHGGNCASRLILPTMQIRE